MKSYLLNVVCAVLISMFCNILLPKEWGKYVKIITGLMIIGAILAPMNLKFSFDELNFENEKAEFEQQAGQYSNELIKEELKKRIEEDAEKRIFEEFNKNVRVNAEIQTNSDNEITGIEKIEISGENIDGKITKRIRQIYNPTEVSVGEF